MTHTSAIPATIAADPNPIEPAAPPPPEVSDAAKRTSGTPERGRDLRGIAGERVDGEAVEVANRQSGVVERQEDRLARHLERGLRERLAALVVRRRAHADDGGLVLDRHDERILARIRASRNFDPDVLVGTGVG